MSTNQGISLPRKPNPGDPISLPAKFIGNLVDIVAERQKARIGGDVELPLGGGIVRAYRSAASGESGPALPPGCVVALGVSAVSPSVNLKAFRTQPVFAIRTEFDANDGARPFFGVLLDPLMDEPNAAARVQLDGVAAVRLRVLDERDLYADVHAGSHALVSSWCGQAEILWKEESDSVVGSSGSDKDADNDGNDDRWALVRLNAMAPRSFFGRVGHAGIPAGESGIVIPYRYTGEGVGSGSGDEQEGEELQVIAHHPPPSEDVDDIPGGSWIQCKMEASAKQWLVDVQYCPKDGSTGSTGTAGSGDPPPGWEPVRRPADLSGSGV